MTNVNIIEATKVNWTTPSTNGNNYPGDANMQIGCLQRIATATEAMAKNHISLQEELERYKRYHKQRGERITELENSIRSYKGTITKLKKKLS